MRSFLVVCALSTVLVGVGRTMAAEATPVIFRLDPPGVPSALSVAGSFNGWGIDSGRMSDADGDGVFEIELDLSPGEHLYKFVLNGREWFTDESAEAFADDGFEGRNSVLRVAADPLVVVGAIAATEGTATGDVGTAAPGRGTPVRFGFRPDPPARVVTVAGTFNDWNPTAVPLYDEDGDGVWETTLRVEPGTHQYKFVVNGSEWFTDETAEEFADDGFGGRNSVLKVGSEPLVVGETGVENPLAGTPITFRFRAGKAHVNAVSVAGTFNGWNAAAHPMGDADDDGIWEAVLRLQPGEYAYQFVIDGDRWMSDPRARRTEDDGFGGKNALLLVGDDPQQVGVR